MCAASSLDSPKCFTPCVHTSSWRSVWGPPCFSAYAYLVTLKTVSRLSVSLRVAGVESPLFICPPVCLRHRRRAAPILTSSLQPRISLLQDGGWRERQRDGRRTRHVTAELTGVFHRVWNPPYVAGGKVRGSWETDGVFGPRGEWVRHTWSVGMGKKTQWSLAYKWRESLPDWERGTGSERRTDVRGCVGLPTCWHRQQWEASLKSKGQKAHTQKLFDTDAYCLNMGQLSNSKANCKQLLEVLQKSPSSLLWKSDFDAYPREFFRSNKGGMWKDFGVC